MLKVAKNELFYLYFELWSGVSTDVSMTALTAAQITSVTTDAEALNACPVVRTIWSCLKT